MKKLMNFRPILFVALSLCSGILCAYFYICANLVWAIIVSAGFILLLTIFLLFFTPKISLKRNLIFSLIFVLFFTFGAITLYSNLDRYERANLSGHNYDITAKIIEINKTSFGHEATLDQVNIDGNRSGELFYKVNLTIYGETNLDVGDIINFNSNLQDYNFIYEDNFNYSCIEKGIKYKANVNAEEITKISNKLTIFERVNLFIRNSLRNGLDEQEFAVGYALLTGNSNFIGRDLITSYRNAGVAHIFAVSGLHIGFLASVLLFLFEKILKKFNINNYIKLLTIAIILIFYSGVCGFSASSLRATIMICVSLLAYNIGQRYDGLTALSFSAIIILLFSPVQLFCVGFQLSFMVVIGIITLAKPISKLFKFLPQKLSSSIGVVVSAQLFSIPICLHAFGQFSIIAVMLNLIFVPIISFIFILTMISTIIGGIFSISAITLFPCNYIFKFINLCISAFDYKIFIVGGFVFGAGIISYYLFLLTVGGNFNFTKIAKRIVSIILIILSIASIIFNNINDYNSVKIFITSNNSISATFISNKGQNSLVVSDVNYIYSVSGLQKVSNKSGQQNINQLIFMNIKELDMQVCISKMLSVFNIERVCYYGDKQQEMEKICEMSFPEISFDNFNDNQDLLIKEFNPKFSMNGKMIIATLKNKKIAIFSKLGDGALTFTNLDLTFDIMISLDRTDSIFSFYSPKIPISYKYNNTYKNAQSNGNILLKFN